MAKKKKVKAPAKQSSPEAEKPVSAKPASGAGEQSVFRSDGLRALFADRMNLYIALGLAIGCLILYGQTVGFNFIGIDDGGYVFDNTVVTQGLSRDSIKWAFTTFSQANWHPLTWLSYLIDSTIFGANPGTYHLVNILFHAANSALLYLVLKYMTGATWRSAMVAGLFAFHPTHVESVAWIAERKDVLSTFFWILTTYFYARYARLKNGDGLGDSKWRRNFYILAIVSMALGIMAKPMIVTLPFALLLLDYWPLRRLEEFRLANIQKLVVEKIPFFILSAVSSVATVIAQKQGGAVVSLEALPFWLRAENAVVAYAKYFVMMFYPANLGITYPYELTIPVWEIAAASALLIVITVFCILQFKDKKYLLVGWLWFIGTLIPVIGLVQVGAQALADRYTYVPYIGLGIMIVWFAADLLERLDRRMVTAGAGGVLILLAVLTFRQTQYWQNSEPLYLHTIAVTEKNGFIEQNLCLLYLNQNRLDEAEAQCRNSIEHAPSYYTPHKLLGVISFKRGNIDEAAANFARALQLRPDDFGSYTDFTVSQLVQGKDLDKAGEMVDKIATAVDMDDVVRQVLLQNYNLLGWGYSKQNNYEKAAHYFGKALELNGDDSDLRTNYGFMLYRAGKSQEGIQQIEESIKQNPDKPEAYNILGTVLSAEGRRDDAIRQFEKAIELKPDYAAAKNNLQKVQSRK